MLVMVFVQQSSEKFATKYSETSQSHQLVLSMGCLPSPSKHTVASQPTHWPAHLPTRGHWGRQSWAESEPIISQHWFWTQVLCLNSLFRGSITNMDTDDSIVANMWTLIFEVFFVVVKFFFSTDDSIQSLRWGNLYEHQFVETSNIITYRHSKA